MRENLIGRKFGRLTVVSELPSRGWHRRLMCVCDCGTRHEASASNLRSKHIQSCGCLQAEVRSATHTKHGMTGNVVCRAWYHMIDRCYNSKHPSFPDYGGRGIKVCEFLRATPANLLHVVGERPSPMLSVDRIQNDLGYFCGSCAECLTNSYPMNLRWATTGEQQNNTRRNRLVTFNGETKTLTAWTKQTGLSISGCRWRVEHGIDLFKPKR